MYRVSFSPSAVRELDRLEATVRDRVIAKAGDLANEPQPHGSKKLSGRENMYRIRTGDFRLLYSIDKKHREVIIAAIQNRREVYRRR